MLKRGLDRYYLQLFFLLIFNQFIKQSNKIPAISKRVKLKCASSKFLCHLYACSPLELRISHY